MSGPHGAVPRPRWAASSWTTHRVLGISSSWWEAAAGRLARYRVTETWRGASSRTAEAGGVRRRQSEKRRTPCRPPLSCGRRYGVNSLSTGAGVLPTGAARAAGPGRSPRGPGRTTPGGPARNRLEDRAHARDVGQPLGEVGRLLDQQAALERGVKTCRCRRAAAPAIRGDPVTRSPVRSTETRFPRTSRSSPSARQWSRGAAQHIVVGGRPPQAEASARAGQQRMARSLRGVGLGHGRTAAGTVAARAAPQPDLRGAHLGAARRPGLSCAGRHPQRQPCLAAVRAAVVDSSASGGSGTSPGPGAQVGQCGRPRCACRRPRADSSPLARRATPGRGSAGVGDVPPTRAGRRAAAAARRVRGARTSPASGCGRGRPPVRENAPSCRSRRSRRRTPAVAGARRHRCRRARRPHARRSARRAALEDAVVPELPDEAALQPGVDSMAAQ